MTPKAIEPGNTIDSEVDILVGDIVALGTDHPNGAFPDGKKPDGTYAVQNEAEAAQTITNLIAQEANKAVVNELKDWRARTLLAANDPLNIRVEMEARIKALTEKGSNNG